MLSLRFFIFITPFHYDIRHFNIDDMTCISFAISAIITLFYFHIHFDIFDIYFFRYYFIILAISFSLRIRWFSFRHDIHAFHASDICQKACIQPVSAFISFLCLRCWFSAFRCFSFSRFLFTFWYDFLWVRISIDFQILLFSIFEYFFSAISFSYIEISLSLDASIFSFSLLLHFHISRFWAFLIYWYFSFFFSLLFSFFSVAFIIFSARLSLFSLSTLII